MSDVSVQACRFNPDEDQQPRVKLLEWDRASRVQKQLVSEQWPFAVHSSECRPQIVMDIEEAMPVVQQRVQKQLVCEIVDV